MFLQLSTMEQDLNSFSGEQMDERGRPEAPVALSVVLDLIIPLSFPGLTRSNFGWYLYVP